MRVNQKVRSLARRDACGRLPTGLLLCSLASGSGFTSFAGRTGEEILPNVMSLGAPYLLHRSAEHGGLKEARWSILGNEWTRSPEQQKQRAELRQQYPKLGRALGLRILGYFESGITSAAIEAINGKLQLAKRIARGFSNFAFFRAIAYPETARLNLNLPSLKPS